MTQQEQDQFRKEFTSIVFTKGVIKSISYHLRMMECYDKGGSHENAILRDIGELDKNKEILKQKLKGRTHSEWRDFSKRLSVLKSKLKQSANPNTVAKWQTEIDNAKFVTHTIVENL